MINDREPAYSEMEKLLHHMRTDSTCSYNAYSERSDDGLALLGQRPELSIELVDTRRVMESVAQLPDRMQR